jgi:hypothetical protein
MVHSPLSICCRFTIPRTNGSKAIEKHILTWTYLCRVVLLRSALIYDVALDQVGTEAASKLPIII